MIQRVKNVLDITCQDVNFSTSSNIEFYIKQDNIFKSYTPTVVSSHNITVVLPKSDMMDFSEGSVALQFALTDADGQPQISDILFTTVTQLLKEAGYGA